MLAWPSISETILGLTLRESKRGGPSEVPFVGDSDSPVLQANLPTVHPGRPCQFADTLLNCRSIAEFPMLHSMS
jgi:hypothetical protein